MNTHCTVCGQPVAPEFWYSHLREWHNLTFTECLKFITALRNTDPGFNDQRDSWNELATHPLLQEHLHAFLAMKLLEKVRS
jgi:hypothetical protein